MMGRAVRTLLIVLVIAMLAVLAAWRAPISWWLPAASGGVAIVPVGAATLGRGEALLDLSRVPGYQAQPGPLLLKWQWCPANGLSSWCVHASGEELSLTTRISGLPVTLEAIAIDELGARWLTPFAPGLINFRLAGSVSRVEVGDLRCPTRRLAIDGGELRVEAVVLAGRNLNDHRIQIEAGPGLVARLSGSDANGSLQLLENRFAWELLWYPKPGATAGLLPPGAAGEGPIRLTEEGAIAC